MSTTTWLQNPARLIAKPLDFFPRASQTSGERADSVARLCIYAAVFAGAYRRSVVAWVIGGLIAAVVMTLFLGGAIGSSKYDDAQIIDNTGPARRPGEGPCSMPTRNNPFANALLTDFGNPKFAPACSLDTPGVREAQRSFFNAGLIRSVYDPWERSNSQRQYYTLPSPTGVSDTRAYRSFLYGNSTTCKEDPQACKGSFP